MPSATVKPENFSRLRCPAHRSFPVLQHHAGQLVMVNVLSVSQSFIPASDRLLQSLMVRLVRALETDRPFGSPVIYGLVLIVRLAKTSEFISGKLRQDTQSGEGQAG